MTTSRQPTGSAGQRASLVPYRHFLFLWWYFYCYSRFFCWQVYLNASEMSVCAVLKLCEHLHMQVSNTWMSTCVQSPLHNKDYSPHISCTDLSLIPVRLVVKLYLTSWCIQNLSKCALNRQTASTSTAELGKQFQILTIQENERVFLYCGLTYD